MPSASEVDTGRVTHDPQMHRHVQWKAPVRVAATGNVTLASAVEAGDTIDGVTLAEFDRVLLPLQTDETDNGIYEVAASGAPSRVYDMDHANEFPGAVVLVLEGTANAGKLYWCTNTTDPVVDDDDIFFDELSSGGGGGGSPLTVQDEGTPLATAATTLNFTGAGVTASGSGATKTVDVPGGISGITVQDEGTPLSTAATAVNFVGDGVTATGSGATKTITIPAGGTVIIPIIFGDGGSTINTGVAGDYYMAFGCTIIGWVLLADVAGAFSVDVWLDDYGAYPPTVADSLFTASISATNIKNKATGLSHSIVADDTLRFNINSVTDIKRVTLALVATRT